MKRRMKIVRRIPTPAAVELRDDTDEYGDAELLAAEAWDDMVWSLRRRVSDAPEVDLGGFSDTLR
ncbi:hypothetical protein ACNUDN_11830 [Mycobacterium sp. smrl_JER01]|uniref:hypothetical protein n=1 Tax=Mycobacterium sp. smrl_JER01 TaxID=3402633 RepID=UPI003AD774B6